MKSHKNNTKINTDNDSDVKKYKKPKVSVEEIAYIEDDNISNKKKKLREKKAAKALLSNIETNEEEEEDKPNKVIGIYLYC